MLQEVIAKMDKKDATYHMKRCVDSGLWVADASTLDTENNDEKETTKQEMISEKKEAEL